jgi:ATP-dependent RNA helicase DDX54/DBP10
MLASNPDILIATPGRLMQLLMETDLKLTRVETLIFDEADNLFEKGF